MPKLKSTNRPGLSAQEVEDRKRPYCVVLATVTPAGTSYKVLSQWTNRLSAEKAVAKTGKGSELMTATNVRKANAELSEKALKQGAADVPSAAVDTEPVPTYVRATDEAPVAVVPTVTLAKLLRKGVHAAISDNVIYATDNPELRDAIYGLQLDMQHDPRIYFPFVDPRTFEGVDPRVPYSELREMDQQELVDLFKALRLDQRSQYLQARAHTYSLHFSEGQQFARACRKFNVCGWMVLTVGKLCGFITEMAHFSGFNDQLLADCCRALRDIGYAQPDQDDAFNTGHTEWSIEGTTAYLTMRCAEEAEVAKWKKYFKDAVQPRERELGTESVALHVSDNIRSKGQRPAYELRIVFHWR